MRAFISHSAADHEFAQALAEDLQSVGVSVWYDEWEIRVGDSIVDKVFGGLHEADALVVVLSRASVESRWVKEELNAATIRRITDNDIVILPVLKEDCPIPLTLRQLRYADFRSDKITGLTSLLNSVEPSRTLWDTLGHLRGYHASIIQQIRGRGLDDPIEEDIDKLQSVMSSALDIRCQIEARRARVKVRKLDLFQKI